MTSQSIKALARQISQVENDSEKSKELLNSAWLTGHHAYRIGVTGPPGAGKSTLVNCLATHFSDQGKKTAVISVDPSSPFTGGAILGDRIRMNTLSSRPNIYIRSMATRGSLGGLSIRTHDVCDILDGAFFDIILIETVGVGQIELDIAQAADVTITVLVPESGDDIQAMKAGIMEISDIFVVNKADRHGAEAMVLNLSSLTKLKTKYATLQWEQPVVKTIANKCEGVDVLLTELDNFKKLLNTENNWELLRLKRMEKKVFNLINEHLNKLFWDEEKRKWLKSEIYSKNTQEKSPFIIVEKLLSK